MVRVAAVQEPGVYFDRDGCLQRAVELIERAAADGIELIVFPEGWIPGYPDFVWGLVPSNNSGDVERLYGRLFANAVDLSADGLSPVRAAAREHGVVVVMGINERASEMSAGTLYNTAVTIDATGEILNVHRKVMPTNAERTVWGFGDGRGLRVVETAVGRVGVLLCWENFMPLARAAIYAQNVEIYCAPTADHRENWLATMQHIGREGSTWVIGVGPTVEDEDIPDDLVARELIAPGAGEWFSPGNGIICSPVGEVVAGPKRREKGMLVADIDLAEVRAARRTFDAVGHYSRPDIFRLDVNREPQLPVTFQPDRQD
ncbi:MAG: carbon-nitrogen hydrolase family protein [bacterium]|nr:carbon-nitrogen hydrolase family protein [bacterium]